MARQSTGICAMDGIQEDKPTPQQQLISHRTILTIPSFISSFTSSIVTLIVGGTRSPARESIPVSFFVHKQVLVTYSGFFSAAFGDNAENESSVQSGWIEKQSFKMYLPEDRVEDIGWLIRWLYWWDANGHTLQARETKESACTQALALWHPSIDSALEELCIYQDRHRQSKLSSHTNNEEMRRPDPPPFGPLIRLYIIADKYSITTDTNALKALICHRAQTIARSAHCIPDKNDISHLWDNIIHGNLIQTMRSTLPPTITKTHTTSTSTSTSSSHTQPQPHPPNISSSSCPPSSCSFSSSESCLKSLFLNFFTSPSLPAASAFNMFATQEQWHAGFLQDLVVKMIHLKITGEEDARTVLRERERDEKKERHERMRVGKVRVLG